MAGLTVVGSRALAAAACTFLIATGVLSGAMPARAAAGDGARVPRSLSTMSLMPWHASPSLVVLRREVDARWPGRSRASDGVIGDPRHSASINSHNPVGAGNGPRVGTPGAVHAMDITASGIDVQAFLRAVIGDPRVWYVIHGGRIWSRTYGWASRQYFGDPHSTHIHVSLREDSHSAAVTAENDVRPWLAGSGVGRQVVLTSPSVPAGASLSTAQVRLLQSALIRQGYAIPAGATGTYGAQTIRAVAAFQRSQGWRGTQADGVAGEETLRRLGVRAAQPAVRRPATSPARAAAPAATPATSTTVALQKALIARGYAIPSGPTGHLGVETKRATAAFQRAQGWRGAQADGIAGPETLRRLGVSTSSGAAGSRGTSAGVRPTKAPKPTKVVVATRATATTRTNRTWDAQNGRLVYDLQNALIAKGYSIPAGPTGYFGTRTKQAVKAFQASLGFRGDQADGIPGPQTLRRLGL